MCESSAERALDGVTCVASAATSFTDKRFSAASFGSALAWALPPVLCRNSEQSIKRLLGLGIFCVGLPGTEAAVDKLARLQRIGVHDAHLQADDALIACDDRLRS